MLSSTDHLHSCSSVLACANWTSIAVQNACREHGQHLERLAQVLANSKEPMCWEMQQDSAAASCADVAGNDTAHLLSVSEQYQTWLHDTQTHVHFVSM